MAAIDDRPPPIDVSKLADAIIAELRRRGPLPARLLLTEAEAAQVLGLSPRTLFTLRQLGKLRAIRIDTGTKNPPVRYALCDLEEYIARARESESPEGEPDRFG